MGRLIRLMLIILASGYYIGCNKVKFDKDPSQDPCLSNPAVCTYINGRYNYTEKISPSMGKVDILIVDDNSGSMSFEQKRMSERFLTFISTLDAKNVDYRIGITTTDISSSDNLQRPINQNGALQDGRLIQFPNGAFYLSRFSGTAQERQNWFAQTIQRNETLACETFVKASPNVLAGSAEYNDHCPSGDERAIMAANMTIEANPSSFIRPEAHLSIVILSDEDVRSSNYFKSNSYTINDLDLPSKLVSNVAVKYPNKTLSVHSIIVKPGALQSATLEQINTALADLTYDPVGARFNPLTYFKNNPSDLNDPSACINQQSSQIPGAGFSGSYGYLYSILSRMTGGIEGDICAADFGSQLSEMGSSIADRVKEIQLRCADAKDLSVVMSPQSNITTNVDGAILRFSDIIPAGTQVTVSYSCSSN